MKNYGGALVKRVQDRENRLVNKIDERERRGDNRENTDTVYNNHTVNEEGARCWSFK